MARHFKVFGLDDLRHVVDDGGVEEDEDDLEVLVVLEHVVEIHVLGIESAHHGVLFQREEEGGHVGRLHVVLAIEDGEELGELVVCQHPMNLLFVAIYDAV